MTHPHVIINSKIAENYISIYVTILAAEHMIIPLRVDFLHPRWSVSKKKQRLFETRRCTKFIHRPHYLGDFCGDSELRSSNSPRNHLFGLGFIKCRSLKRRVLYFSFAHSLIERKTAAEHMIVSTPGFFLRRYLARWFIELSNATQKFKRERPGAELSYDLRRQI